VLCNLAMDDAISMVIADAGAIGMVVAAMTAHVGHAKLQEQAVWTLMNICGTDARAPNFWKLQKRIQDEGGVGVVVDAVDAGTTLRTFKFGHILLEKLWRKPTDPFPVSAAEYAEIKSLQ